MTKYDIILLCNSWAGEWWNKNVNDVEIDAHLTGLGQDISDALTLNGLPGDQTPCTGTTPETCFTQLTSE